MIPQLGEGRLHCPCHNGYFDLATGRPIAGPPRRPLPRIKLEVRDGVIYATGVEERTAYETSPFAAQPAADDLRTASCVWSLVLSCCSSGC